MKLEPEPHTDASGTSRQRTLRLTAQTPNEGVILQAVFRAFMEGATLAILFPDGERVAVTPGGRICELN